MIKTRFPSAVDDFLLTKSAAERNSLIEHDRSLGLEDLAYALRAAESKLGADDSDDEASLDFRVRTAEDELDAVILDVAALADAARRSVANTFTQKQTLPGLDLTGKVTKYNNVATEGYGLPAIVDQEFVTTRHTDLALVHSNTSPTGLYRISVSLMSSAEDLDSSTVAVKVTYTTFQDGEVTETLGTVTLTVSGRGQYTFVVYHQGGGISSLTTTFDYTSVGGSSDEYIASVAVERLA